MTIQKLPASTAVSVLALLLGCKTCWAQAPAVPIGPAVTITGVAPGIVTSVVSPALTGSANVTAMNAQAAALKAAGGGTIILPEGTLHIAGLNMYSTVHYTGQGSATNLVCDASPCVTQPAGSQVYNGGVTNVAFSPNTGQAGATVINITSAQKSEFGNFYFSGFTTGALLNMAGATVTSFDNPTLGSNIIFNNFHDWLDLDGVANVLSIEGLYGASPPSPNSGGMVVTQNSFTNINARFSGTGINIIADTDTNFFYNIYLAATAIGATYIAQGNDPVYSGVNTYVSNNKFLGLTFSTNGGGETGLTFFGGNYSYATEVYGLSSDVPAGNFTLNAMTMDQSHCFNGSEVDGLTGASSYTSLTKDCLNVFRHNRTFTAAPSTGFAILGSSVTGYDAVWLTNGSLLASGTLQFPCSSEDGDKYSFGSLFGVTTFTPQVCAGSSDHLQGTPTSLAAGVVYRFVYVKASGYWVPD